MPTSEAAERRAVRAQQMGAPLPPVDQDPLPCPRCNSTNTKFCYYNNYNFSQPRHFCKSCRRYWTQGGTLRDIPVGGGSRKTAKRSRTSPSSGPDPHCSVISTSSGPTTACSVGAVMDPVPATPVTCGGFTSLLSSAGPGILALGGFGIGLGLEDVGFGLGRGVWAFPEVGYVNGGISMNGGGVASSGGGTGGGDGGCCVSRGGDTWHVESSGDQGGYVGVGVDCFTSLPDLAISTTTGNGLK